MFDSIKYLIAQNSLKEAINEIVCLSESIKNKAYNNAVILQNARLSGINQEYDEGSINKENYKTEVLRLNKALLNVLSDIETDVLQSLHEIDFPISNIAISNLDINDKYDIKVVNEVKQQMYQSENGKYRTLVSWNIKEDTQDNFEKGTTTSAYVIGYNCLNGIDDFPYFDIIWFIDTKSEILIYKSLKMLAQKLNFPVSDNESFFLNDFKKYLEIIDLEWLLIFLDVCDSDTQEWNTKVFDNKFFPKTHDKKQIVFTSKNWERLKNWENIMEIQQKNLRKITKTIVIGFVCMISIFIPLYFYINLSKTLTEEVRNNIFSKLPPIITVFDLIKDNSGDSAFIAIDILSKDFTWIKRETISAEYLHEGKKISLRDYFELQSYKDRINASIDIVCFGNSSFEEDSLLTNKEGLIREETRALARAENLGIIIKEKLTKEKTTIYTLNLGKNNTALVKGANSDVQRTIIIVRVLTKNKDIDLKQALYNGILKNKQMPFKISEYSKIRSGNFDLQVYANPINPY